MKWQMAGGWQRRPALLPSLESLVKNEEEEEGKRLLLLAGLTTTRSCCGGGEVRATTGEGRWLWRLGMTGENGKEKVRGRKKEE